MKKFFNDHAALLIATAIVVAGVALYFGISNGKKLKAIKSCSCTSTPAVSGTDKTAPVDPADPPAGEGKSN